MREDFKKLLTIGGGITFLVVLVSYSIFQGRNILFGGSLSVVPVESATEAPIIDLQGVAARAKAITINGRTAPLDASGNFSESVALLPGLNVITVSSIDAFGKTKTETIYTYHTTAARTAVNIPPPEPQQADTIIN